MRLRALTHPIARVAIWSIRTVCLFAALVCIALCTANLWGEPLLCSEGNWVFQVKHGALIGYKHIFPEPFATYDGIPVRDLTIRTYWRPRSGARSWPGHFGTPRFEGSGGTLKRWTLVLPLWIPSVAFAAVFAITRLPRIRRARVGFCPKCGYDRAGLVAGSVCPECGAGVR